MCDMAFFNISSKSAKKASGNPNKLGLAAKLPILFVFGLAALVFGPSSVKAQEVSQEAPATNLEIQTQDVPTNLTLKYPIPDPILPIPKTKVIPKLAPAPSNYAIKARNIVKDLGGSIAIVDESNNPLLTHKPNDVYQPASTWKLATALSVFTYYPVTPKSNTLFKRDTFELVKYVLDHSDNGWADKLAQKVGLSNLDALAEKVTGNYNISVPNGSGCPRGLAGSDCSYPSGKKPIYLSANDSIKILDALDQTVSQQGFSITNLIGSVNKPGSTTYDRFHQDFTGLSKAQVYGKTGSFYQSLTFSGFMYNRYGQKIKYAFLSQGSHSRVGNLQGALLRNLWMSSVDELAQAGGR
jgi:hypothetical protein